MTIATATVAVDTMLRRAVEVTFTDGTKTLAKGYRLTAVRAGNTPSPIRPDVAADWKALYERAGRQVARVRFVYRKA